MQMDKLIEEVKKTNAKKVMIQVPAGLKTRTTEIIETLEKNSVSAVASLSNSYGACDLADNEAKRAGCDLLVHIGHSKFYRDFSTDVPVLYFPWTIDIDIDGVDFSTIEEKRVGLLSTIQHLNSLPKIQKTLEKNGKEAVIGGQVLGCWFDNANKISDGVDAFLFVGSGKFHPLGLQDKKIYILDAEKRSISVVDRSSIEKRRYANIFNAKDAKTFAVIVTAKKGQMGLLGKAEQIREKIENNDRQAFIFVTNEINDNALAGLKVDAFVNTGCPRIAEDHFSKPMINATDVDKLFL